MNKKVELKDKTANGTKPVLAVRSLSVGNLLKRNGIIVKIDAKSIFDIWDDNGIDKLGYEPIPLTEEWLLRFGFKKEEKSPSKNHGNYYSVWLMDYKYSFSYAAFREDWGFYHSYTDALKDEDNDKFDFISCGIKYVHELQNLYYSLSQDELSWNDR